MSQLAERLRDRFYRDEDHPYRVFERRLLDLLAPEHCVLDAGCGYTAPVLRTLIGKARTLIGVDLVEFDREIPGLTLLNRDLTSTGLSDRSVDLVISRSVMEHVCDAPAVYAEMARVLRPGGHFLFLTANLWDYASLVSKVVPNRFHGRIVSAVEGRAEKDVFPVQYRSNTREAIRRLAMDAGFRPVGIEYLSQYPNYFLFSAPLFAVAMGYERIVATVPQLSWLRGWILATLQRA